MNVCIGVLRTPAARSSHAASRWQLVPVSAVNNLSLTWRIKSASIPAVVLMFVSPHQRLESDEPTRLDDRILPGAGNTRWYWVGLSAPGSMALEAELQPSRSPSKTMAVGTHRPPTLGRFVGLPLDYEEG